MKSVFLKAEWKNLVMANYVVEPSVLRPYLPANTELDFWNGRCYVSLVGFMFLKTKVMGMSIPWHRDFEEVNLRFYVRFKDREEWKRGTVFIKEIVPKRAITWVANTLYNEHYMTLPMRHQWQDLQNGMKQVEYSWKSDCWNFIKVKTDAVPQALTEGSEAQFITEHYWGYTKLAGNRTSEYQVEHPSWQVYRVQDFEIQCSGNLLYGQPFGEILDRRPESIFMAEGSEVLVRRGRLV